MCNRETKELTERKSFIPISYTVSDVVTPQSVGDILLALIRSPLELNPEGFDRSVRTENTREEWGRDPVG